MDAWKYQSQHTDDLEKSKLLLSRWAVSGLACTIPFLTCDFLCCLYSFGQGFTFYGVCHQSFSGFFFFFPSLLGRMLLNVCPSIRLCNLTLIFYLVLVSYPFIRNSQESPNEKSLETQHLCKPVALSLGCILLIWQLIKTQIIGPHPLGILL